MSQKETNKTVFGYAMGQVVPGAFAVNFVLNMLAAWLVYGGRTSLPMSGEGSVGADTLIGAFLISFITLSLATPSARREANAGRIPGGGKGGVFAFSKNKPGLSSFLLALVLCVVMGIGAMIVVSPLAPEKMGFGMFVWFKAISSAFFGGIAALLAALLGAGSALSPREDERWCKEPDAPTKGPTYAFDYIDKGGVGVTSEEHGCSGTPTWQLVVSGALEEAHVRQALEDTFVRYPQLRTIVQSLDGHPEYATHFRYAPDPHFSIDRIFEVVDLRGEEAQASKLNEVIDEVHNRHTDQFRDPPVTLTMAITSDESCRLLFRQHHGVADGRAFIELLTDFAAFLRLARSGERPSAAALMPIPKRGETEGLGLHFGQTIRFTIEGLVWFFRSLFQTWFAPPRSLIQNDSNDYTGANGTLHWVIDDAVIEAWRAPRKEMGVSLNSLLTAAIYEANRRWHREQGRDTERTVATLVMETRPRGGHFRSFANHLATLEVMVDLSEDNDVPGIARSIQEQVVFQRDHKIPIKRLLAERLLVLGMSMDRVRQQVFQKPHANDNINFSNLIPLFFPTMEGEGWKVEEVLITTPITPRHGIVFTVIRYNGKVIFNINYKASAATREQAAALFGHFRAVMEEYTKVIPEELDTAAAPIFGERGEDDEADAIQEAVPLAAKADTSETKDPWWQSWLLHRYTPLWAALLSVLLVSSTLIIGVVLDDQLHWLQIDGAKSPHYTKRSLDLFHFISDDNRKPLMESGAYPWWTAPKLQLAFYRPISSLTHWLDYKYWPHSPLLMHLHSLLWFGLMILMVAFLYRRMIPIPWAAGLAAFLYAMDECHGLSAGWLANRNALIATTMAALVLIIHDKWRRESWSLGVILAPLVLLMGLLSGEFAIFSVGYLFAYALFIEEEKGLWRWVSLVPYAAVVVGWRVVYKIMGYGAQQSGAYIDPLGESGRFVISMFERLPTLLLAQWSLFSADFWMTQSNTYNASHAAFGAVLLLLIAWIVVPLLREDRVARFWALGMLLSAVPICATFPHDRVLFGVGIGAMGLIAQFLCVRFGKDGSERPNPRASALQVRGLAMFFIVCHVYLAPFFLPLKSISPFFLERLERRSFQTLPKAKDIRKKQVFLIHTPGFLSHTFYAMYALKRMPQPKVLRQLSITIKGLKVTRLDARTLRLEAEEDLVDRSTRMLVRSTAMAFHVGQTFRYPDVSVTVKKLGVHGRPSVAVFRFKHRLEHPDYLWMRWKGSGFAKCKLPKVGQSIKLKAMNTTEIFL